MDTVNLLKDRTRFIRRLYDGATEAFVERKRRIDANEEPYRVTGTPEEGAEPPFLYEWIAAEESIDVLGQTAVSMLATALNLYLVAWVDALRQGWGDSLEKVGADGPSHNSIRKRGWFTAYRDFFDDVLKIKWADGPVDPAVLEELVLIRNTAQHPEDIGFIWLRQTEYHFEKYPRSYFADQRELELFDAASADGSSLPMRPWRLSVTRDKLFEALDLVDRFGDYLADAFEQWPNAAWKAARAAAE